MKIELAKQNKNQEQFSKDEKFEGIGKKISKYIFLLVICCNILIGAVCIYLNYISSISTLEKTMNETSTIASERVRAELKEYKAIAFECGSIARLAKTDTPLEDKKSIIEQRVKTHNLISGDILNQEGISIFDKNVNLSDTDFFKEALSGVSYIGDPKTKDGYFTYHVAAPLWENGIPDTKVVGVIVFVPDYNFMNTIVQSIHVGEKGSAYVLDKNGLVLAHTDETKAGVENTIEEAKSDKSLSKIAELEEKMIKGEDGYGSYSYGGVSKIMSYSPIEDTNGWSISITAVKTEFMDKLYISVGLTVGMIIVFTIIGVLNGIKLGKRIAKPIKLCVDRLRLLETGDLKSPVPEPITNDETKLLLESLGHTVISLQGVVKDIENEVTELSKGNLCVDIDNIYKGDFAAISYAFKDVFSTLNEAMKNIDANAGRVNNGSEELSKASQTLAEGATDQASTVEELTAAVTEMSSKIQGNADNAKEAEMIVTGANNAMLDGDKQMKNLLLAMEKITSASNEIANIIKTIEDIASQTNLLSLNAAIEAARAGEAGKGFAVVADEVRALAEQSSAAATETTRLIENAIEAVKEGTVLAESTTTQMNIVVDKASETVKAIQNIAAASEEQAASANQITEGLNQIVEVIQMNSATAQESAASSEELASEANILKELVAKFQYK